MEDEDIICDMRNCPLHATHFYTSKRGGLFIRCDHHLKTLLESDIEFVPLTKNEVIVNNIHET